MMKNSTLENYKNLIKALKLAGIIALVIILAFSAIITLFPNSFISWPQVIDNLFNSKTSTYDDQIVFLDVGQADCTAIMSNGEVALVDLGHSGGGGKNITQHLNNLAIKNIKYIIFTHYHTDHIGSLETIAEKFNVDTVILNNYFSISNTDVKAVEKLNKTIDKFKINKEYVSNDKTIKLGNFTLTLNTAGLIQTDENENSTVVSAECNGVKTLLLSDSGKEIMGVIYDANKNYNIDTTYDILKVAHHGAEDSTNLDFLKLVLPKHAIISCGKDNLYGHPHASVLKDLENIGAKVLRTDINGNITVKITDNKIYEVRPTKQ